MTECERLIELIDDYRHEITFCGRCDRPAEDCEGCENEQIADYLLANGVIVPPCNIGNEVYRIVKMRTGVRNKINAVSGKEGTTGIMTPRNPTIKRFIRCVTVTKNNIVDCCENYGKTIFLTRKEAEKALEEMR